MEFGKKNRTEVHAAEKDTPRAIQDLFLVSTATFPIQKAKYEQIIARSSYFFICLVYVRYSARCKDFTRCRIMKNCWHVPSEYPIGFLTRWLMFSYRSRFVGHASIWNFIILTKALMCKLSRSNGVSILRSYYLHAEKAIWKSSVVWYFEHNGFGYEDTHFDNARWAFCRMDTGTQIFEYGSAYSYSRKLFQRCVRTKISSIRRTVCCNAIPAPYLQR